MSVSFPDTDIRSKSRTAEGTTKHEGDFVYSFLFSLSTSEFSIVSIKLCTPIFIVAIRNSSQYIGSMVRVCFPT